MILNDIIIALWGRFEWIRLKKEYKVKDGVLVLLMVDNRETVNSYALKHLECFRKKKYMDRVLILTDQNKVQIWGAEHQIKRTKIILMKTMQCNALLKYYQLQRFYSDFLVVSLTQPAGNTVGNMLQSEKMTEEELLLGSIYA